MHVIIYILFLILDASNGTSTTTISNINTQVHNNDNQQNAQNDKIATTESNISESSLSKLSTTTTATEEITEKQQSVGVKDISENDDDSDKIMQTTTISHQPEFIKGRALNLSSLSSSIGQEETSSVSPAGSAVNYVTTQQPSKIKNKMAADLADVSMDEYDDVEKEMDMSVSEPDKHEAVTPATSADLNGCLYDGNMYKVIN